MAIGSVILSVKIALFGSVYMSVVRDLAFLEGLTSYSALGCLVLTAMLLGFGVEQRARYPRQQVWVRGECAVVKHHGGQFERERQASTVFLDGDGGDEEFDGVFGRTFPNQPIPQQHDQIAIFNIPIDDLILAQRVQPPTLAQRAKQFAIQHAAPPIVNYLPCPIHALKD